MLANQSRLQALPTRHATFSAASLAAAIRSVAAAKQPALP